MLALAVVVFLRVARITATLAATAGPRTTATRSTSCGNEVIVAPVVVMLVVVLVAVAALEVVAYSSGSCIGSSRIVFVVIV